jgi:hypothetical protein
LSDSTTYTPIIYMPEIIMHKIVEIGIYDLQQNPDKLDYIFNTYNLEYLEPIFGDNYIEEIKEWFTNIEVPVVQSWSFNPDRIPCISVHLNSEVEDIEKAAMNDHFQYDDNDGTEEVKIGVFNVSITLGVHAARNGNYVLWLYYILHHIFFTNKLVFERLGFQIQTFTGGDYIHGQKYITNNIWSRWVNFNCTVQNCWKITSETEYDIILRAFADRKNSLDDSEKIKIYEK